MATVVGMIAEGMGTQEILASYPDLEAEDLREALRFAADGVRHPGSAGRNGASSPRGRSPGGIRP